MRSDRTLWALVLVVAFGLAMAWWRAPASTPGDMPDAAAELSGVLGGAGDELAGFARVTGPRPFEFPRDHGAHPDHRSEWWYFTGNLSSTDGRAFGFQLTFFRFALAPEPVTRPSDWATRQVWMAHFAVTDIASGEHYEFERFQRGALGLAGAAQSPLRVWLDDWSMRSDAGGGLFPLRLQAQAGEVAIDLRLTARKPLVLQGDRGYSAKSDAPGNASHYYSYTRLAAEGVVRVPAGAAEVRGGAWLDREWSTSALAEDQAGWDWFSLQLDDGRDLMVYRLRGQDGSTDPASAGVLVAPDGDVRRLGVNDFRLQPLEYWVSPVSGVRYPVAWRVQVPGAGLDLTVSARVDAQEMNTAFRYWEGAVRVTSRTGAGVTGLGYLEMTGYEAGTEQRGARPSGGGT
jgi:predicted secreted hydrolase